MQEKFGDKLNVKICTTDSEEAKGYTFNSATNVLFSKEWLPLNMAMDTEKMEDFLSKKL